MPDAARRKFKVGLVQMAMSFNLDENLASAVDKVEEAARRGAEVVCLPELFRSPYFCQREDAAMFDLAEPVPGPSTNTFSTLAQRLGVAVVVPVFERRTLGVYHNSVAVVDNSGRVLGLYRKM